MVLSLAVRGGGADPFKGTLSLMQGSPIDESAAAVRAPRPADPGRSRNMRAIRRADTKPELALRSRLHRAGFRFRKDYRLDLEGLRVRPDLVFTRRRLAVFVDGCFWHVCPVHGRQPETNDWYWTPKLRRNVERDRLADEALMAAGWHVLRVWEHTSIEEAVELVVTALEHRTEAN